MDPGELLICGWQTANDLSPNVEFTLGTSSMELEATADITERRSLVFWRSLSGTLELELGRVVTCKQAFLA